MAPFSRLHVSAPWRDVLWCSVVALCIAANGLHAELAAAQDQSGESATGLEPQLPLDEVIVTGTSRERRIFDAPYSISTLSQHDMELYAPLSTVDLFGKLPGFGAEPSGGEAGNNVNVRGLPTSNFRFVAVVEDGLPIFQEQQEPFLNADELSRIDLMTERVEAIRGGTSSIFESNAPGATVNLITRLGTEQPQGSVRLTTGDFGMYRLDGYWSGPLPGGLLLAVGGYYRVDDGPRPTGFTADQGGQLRINLTKRFDAVELTVYAKRLDDRTIFYLPIPLADPRNPSATLANLLDPRTGTLTSSDTQYVTLRTLNGTAAGTTVSENMGDGIHPRVNTFGANFDWRAPGGLRVSNKLRFSEGPVGFNALFSLFPPQDAAGFLADQLSRAQAAFGSTVTSLAYVLANPNAPGAGRIPFDPTTTGGLVVQGGWWSVDNHINTFADDLRVSSSFSPAGWGRQDLSAGVYFSHYVLSQTRLFNTMLLQMRDRPQALDVVALDNAGNAVGSVTENGFLSYGDSTSPGGHVAGQLWALYGTGEWDLSERIKIDVGLRHQQTWQHGYAMLYATQDVGNPQYLADAAVGGPSGARDYRWEQFSATAWTLGTTYEFSRDAMAFARYTFSFRTPDLTDIYTGPTQVSPVVTKVREAELGLKLRGHGIALFATAFWNRFDPYSDSVSVESGNGQLTSVPFIGQTSTYGLELQGDWQPMLLFDLSGSLTLQKPAFENLAALGGGSVAGVDGNQVERIPEIVGSVTPRLNFTVQEHPTELYLTLYYQGRRFVDAANSTQLPAYTTLDAGLISHITDRLRIQLVGTNLTNTIGLTEGNPRVDTIVGQGTPQAIYARPIFGRLFRASLTYDW